MGDKALYTLKGGYIVGTLIGATLFQGTGIHHLEVRMICVSFEKYGYLSISPIGRMKVTVSYLYCESGEGKSFSLSKNQSAILAS